MASVLKVDKLDPQSGTALEIGTSGDTLNVPSGVTLDINAGATLDATGATVTGAIGKVLQVAQASISVSVSSASATFVTAGFTATFSSLSSTSSKVLCTLAGGRISYADAAVNPNKMSVTLYSSIDGATATDIMSSAPFSHTDLYSGGGGFSYSHAGCFLYSPSTTDSVAITPYYRAVNDYGTPYFNHLSTSGEASNIPATVTLTLMEIGA